MNVVDVPLTLRCGNDRLLAMLSRPAEPRDTAVVVIVGGPQYRAGSHRQFVLLARRLAADGWPVLRFDARGMGDSEGDARTFESIDDDIAAAIDGVRRALPGVRRVVLWGLCDGASAALMYCGRTEPDRQVAGLCLLNPWLRSEASLARTQVKHYYARRLAQPAFWSKLLRGGLGLAAVNDLLGNIRAATGGTKRAAQGSGDFRDAMASAWSRYAGRILLVVSGADLTAREFVDGLRTDPRWRGAETRRDVERCDLVAADHTFSHAVDREAMEGAMLRWLAAGFADEPAPAACIRLETSCS